MKGVDVDALNFPSEISFYWVSDPPRPASDFLGHLRQASYTVLLLDESSPVSKRGSDSDEE